MIFRNAEIPQGLCSLIFRNRNKLYFHSTKGFSRMHISMCITF